MPTAAPSGAQHEIRHRDSRATVAEVGATLRQLRLNGVEVLDGFDVGERAPAGAGQLLLPWPNRIRDGRYRWHGQDQQLPLTEPEAGNAIHGLTRWSAWTAAGGGESWVTLAHRLHPQPGWPGAVDLTATYRLDDDGLRVELEARNLGAGSVPFGAGAHPYLRLAPHRADDLVLTVPAATRLVTDDRAIPVGSEPVAGTPYDFRRPRSIGALALDTAFTDLERDGAGAWRVTLESPVGGRVWVWGGGTFAHVMVFTGDTLSGPRRRRAVAVEPMSCPPDAFNRPGSHAVLEPGDAWNGEFGVSAGGIG